MLRLVRFLALGFVILLGGVWAVAWFGRAPGESIADAFLRRIAALTGADMPAPSAGGIQLAQGVALGGPFTLVDHTGRTVTERDFAGRALLVYFGFTYCPDVCPTELGTIAAALDAMGTAGERVTPVFISIDPARDTPELLARFTEYMHPRMIGLTGTPEQVAAASRAYRTFYRVQDPEQEFYLIDHSTLTYLVFPDLGFVEYFRRDVTPEEMAARVACFVESRKRN